MSCSVVVAEHLDRAVVGLQGVVEGQLVVGQAEFLAAAAGLAHLLGQLDQLLDDLRRLDGAVLVLADGLLQHLGEGPGLHHVASRARVLISSLSSFCSSSTARLRCGRSSHLGEELVREDRDVGLLQPGGGEDVDHLLGRHGLGDDLPDGVVEVLVGRCRRRRPLLTSAARTAWKKPTSSRMRDRLVVRDGQGERLGQLGDGLQRCAPCRPPGPRMCSWAAGRTRQPLAAACRSSSADQSKPWNRPQQISYFSSITATASAWSMAVLPVPPLSV